MANGDFEVTYQLVVENTGNVDLGDVSLVDDIATQFGGAFVSAGSLTLITPPGNIDSNIVLDSANWDGSAATEMINQAANNTLKTGDLFIVQITVVVDPDASGTSGPLNNQATTGGNAVDDMGNPITDSTGAPITTTDDSDNGTDPNSDNGSGTSDDPTPLAIPDLSTAKSVIGSPVANGDSFDVTFEVVLENTGTVDLNGIDLFDDLAMQFGSAFVSVDQTSLALDTTGVASGSLPTLNTTCLLYTSPSPRD